MTKYYTADLHLNHARLTDIKFRNFDDEVAMNAKILENINATVGKDDILYILGDLCMSNEVNDAYVSEWLKAIRCNNIIIIMGNHDKASRLRILKEKKIIANWHYSKIINDTAFGLDFCIALFHHPVIDYHSGKEAATCFHGHSHGYLKQHPPDLFDVGVDVWDFKPVTAEQVLSRYFGDHPNPYIGYMDTFKKYQTEYKQFLENFEMIR
jgi:calcineurin-like phosphoesterase family protein